MEVPRSSVCGEISVQDGRYHSHERLRKESVAKQRANQDCDWNTETEPKIDNVFPSLAESPHERLAVGPQHVNGRDHYSPKRKHRRDLKDVKAIHLPTVLERAKKNHDFPGKVCESRQADRCKYAEAKSETGKGHHFGEAAKFLKNQCAGALPQFS